MIADTHEQALGALALDWHDSFAGAEDAIMIARRNRDVAELNAIGRELLVAEGRLRGAQVEVGGQTFAVGDRVITRVNTPHVSNRERWEVTAIDAARREVELQRIGGDERRVALGSRYLDFSTPSGEPSLQHAYAISAYAAESKTFEQAFTLLDPGAGREEFLVSVSRSRGPTTAYGVAALELTDAELGPGTRPIEDAAHELRVAAERPGDELPALEVSERQRVASMNELGLAERLHELQRREREAQRASPEREQLASLDHWIDQVQEQLDGLRGEYAELVSERRPDAQRIDVVATAGRAAADRLAELNRERAELAEHVSSKVRLAPLAPAERMELGLIEERMAQLRRRDIAFERLDPSPMIREALGERPSDPLRAAAWNQGVDAIYSYRQRHNIRSHEQGALGAEPSGEHRRREWRQTRRRLEQVRAVLDSDRSIEKGAEHDIGIGA